MLAAPAHLKSAGAAAPDGAPSSEDAPAATDAVVVRPA